MDATILRRALKFGDGTRTDRRARGIGRFGVGLPQSSVSQCQRVDIWTWTQGADNALRCYLDLEEIRSKGRQEVPVPTPNPVPQRWRGVIDSSYSESGTLVVWTKLDRVRWSGVRTTLDRTAALCGRIYRKFITDPDRPIALRLISSTDDGQDLTIVHERDCTPNDPLYLMTPSSTPPPFQDKPMFRLFSERRWEINVDGTVGVIHARCSLARPESINETTSKVAWPKSYPNPGNSPWGKHADRNKGVSIVRARRELEMSIAWVNNYEPEERWWSVEVEFDPILDDIFGVVNNKQHAHAFVAGAGFDLKKFREMADPDESLGTFRERLEETKDPRAHLLDVWSWINDQITRMRRERSKLRAGTRTPRHPQTEKPLEQVATEIMTEQAERGETGDSDKAPSATSDEKIRQLTESAKRVRVDEQTAQKWAEETVRSGRRVLIKAVTLNHRDAFFDVESVNDVIEVWLNERHPVHEHLMEVVSADIGEQTPEELAKRLQKAAFTLRMLFIAWARHEDKAPAGLKEPLEDARMDWGREARRFLSVIDE